MVFEGKNGGLAHHQFRGETWAMLLSRWTDFARAAVALPEDGEGERWRRSIAPIIELQAVTCALGEVAALERAERLRGLDLAAVLIRRSAAALSEAWRGEPMPEKVMELVQDAQRAHEQASWLGVELVAASKRLVVEPVRGLVEALVAAGHTGEVLAARAGTILFEGEPVLFVRDCADEVAARVEMAHTRTTEGLVPARQVYRQADERTGRLTRDVVTAYVGVLEAGRPLLEVAAADGEVLVREDDAQAAAWRAAQERAMGEGGVEVVFGMRE